MMCSICFETNDIKLVKIDIGKGRTQEIPYCKRHREKLNLPKKQEIKSPEKIVARCCGHLVNPESGRCNRCGDRYD